MYCGCNPIAHTSQLQVSQALLRLMEQKSYAAITVSELCRAAGISRQTFYTLFSSMENVVLFILRERACELPGDGADGPSLEQVCRSYSRYICGNRDFLKLLVENNVGYLLYYSIYGAFSQCSECVCSLPGTERDYIAHFLAGGLTGVVQQYCTQEPPIEAEELYRILRHLFLGTRFS